LLPPYIAQQQSFNSGGHEKQQLTFRQCIMCKNHAVCRRSR